MDQLDSVLDDALAGFDDDDDPQSSSTQHPTSSIVELRSPETAAKVAAGSTTVTAIDSIDGSAKHVPAAAAGDAISNKPTATPAAAAIKQAGGLQFDPLKRKKKSKGSGFGASSSSSSSRPALTPEVQKLQEDLAQLVSDWSQALHPEAEVEPPPAAGSQHQRRQSTVLQALAEQTQKTVEQQSRLKQPPAGGSAATMDATGSGSMAGEQQQVNMIVDTVMQHLLSKDVLYQPMKEIMEKYPPWLAKQEAAGSNSSLSPTDLERYKQQYAAICALCQAYETEPGSTGKIMDLLQQMQAYGEPPADIVEEMSTAIAADLPGLGLGGTGEAADSDFENFDVGDLNLDSLPAELKNCPVQ
eukprot:gene13748-13867_t